MWGMIIEEEIIDVKIIEEMIPETEFHKTLKVIITQAEV